MSKAPNKRVLEDGREGTPPRALRGSTGVFSGVVSWDTTARTLWRSFTSRIGPQHPEKHCECSGRYSNTVRTGQALPEPAKTFTAESGMVNLPYYHSFVHVDHFLSG